MEHSAVTKSILGTSMIGAVELVESMPVDVLIKSIVQVIMGIATIASLFRKPKDKKEF